MFNLSLNLLTPSENHVVSISVVSTKKKNSSVNQHLDGTNRWLLYNWPTRIIRIVKLMCILLNIKNVKRLSDQYCTINTWLVHQLVISNPHHDPSDFAEGYVTASCRGLRNWSVCWLRALFLSHTHSQASSYCCCVQLSITTSTTMLHNLTN